MKAFHSPFSRCTLKTVSKDHALGQGVRNKFARFNGTTDYATVEAFVYPTAAGTVLVRCRADSASPDAGKAGLVEINNGVGTSHYPYSDGTAYISSFRATRVNAITLSESVDRTAWHWLIVRDNAGSGWEMLQAEDDGTLHSVATAAHEAFPSPDMTIAKSNTAFWDGDIDRFLLFSTRLSDAAIQAIIAGGNGTSPLVRYEFSSNDDGIFSDASGNGYDATISGTPTIVSA